MEGVIPGTDVTPVDPKTVVTNVLPAAVPAVEGSDNDNSSSSSNNRGSSSRGRRRSNSGRQQQHKGRAPIAPSQLPAFTEGRKMLAVASRSPVKKVAGSIAHTSRESDPPVLSAVGPSSVNQAVKAIAIARTYLVDDQLDLVVEVQRGDSGGDIKDLIFLNLKKVPLRAEGVLPAGEVQNLKSAGKSGTSQLAGAVAKNIRESKSVKITAVGENPVFRAVDAIVFSRKYLFDDGIDVDFQPEFTHVTFSNGTEVNALEFIILSHQIS